MKNAKPIALLIFLVCLASGVFAIDLVPQPYLAPQPYSIATESIDSPGMAVVIIRAATDNAFITVDGITVGTSSWAGKLVPGTHVVSASAADHYPFHFLLAVQENTKYTIDIRLAPHTGFLSIEITPIDAEIHIDGGRVHYGFLELPVGFHSITVKKFGFNEKTTRILILRNRTSVVRMDLVPSIFAITNFQAKPDSFNPSNKGLYNRVLVRFSVTAPGFGTIEIRDSAGVLVRLVVLPEFRTWSQRFEWRGTGENGRPVPDGEYGIKLSLWPVQEKIAPEFLPGELPSSGATDSGGGEEAPISFTTTVRIDSTLKIVPSGSSGARPGMLYFADPKVSELLPGSVDFLICVADNGVGGSSSAAFKIGSSTMLAVEGIFDPTGAAGSILSNIAHRDGFDMAFMGRIAWSDNPAPKFPGAGSEAEVSLPLALNSKGFRAGVAPGVVYDFRNQYFAPRLGAGLWFENQGMVAGLSAQASFGPGGFASPANPLLVGAETRLLFDRVPITLTFRLSAAFEPAPTSPAASLGFGVAF